MEKRGSDPEIEITSLPTLSQKIWGLHRRELLVIGGRTSQGKTTLAMQLGKDAAKQGFRVHLLSLEMSEEALVERLMCNVCGIPSGVLKTGVKDFDKKMVKEFYDFLGTMPFLITYNIGSTKQELEDVISDLPKPDVVIVDYVQAIRKLDMDKMSSMNEYILSLRAQAVKRNFVAILVSQINRGAMDSESKMPALWQLKGSGTIEEHADMVLLTHWNYFYNAAKSPINDFHIIVAKNRNGSTGTHRCQYEPEHYRFSEYAVDPDALKDPTVKSAMSTLDAKIVNSGGGACGLTPAC